MVWDFTVKWTLRYPEILDGKCWNVMARMSAAWCSNRVLLVALFSAHSKWKLQGSASHDPSDQAGIDATHHHQPSDGSQGSHSSSPRMVPIKHTIDGAVLKPVRFGEIETPRNLRCLQLEACQTVRKWRIREKMGFLQVGRRSHLRFSDHHSRIWVESLEWRVWSVKCGAESGEWRV